jgi:hypothetical protein
MGQFDDLTPTQKLFLQRLVAVALEGGGDTYGLSPSHDSVALKSVTNPEIELPNVPRFDVFYDALVSLGYLGASVSASALTVIQLQRRAYDYAAYAAHSARRRWWSDLRYDLAHDESIRSRFTWHAVAVILSVAISTGVALLLGRLGVL